MMDTLFDQEELRTLREPMACDWRVEVADVSDWSRGYNGERFHSLMGDSPYHLSSIVRRFGKEGSAEAKGDVYHRGSRGFRGESWDGGDVAFRKETWAGFLPHLYPGAFLLAFAGTRGYHRMAMAIEDSGFTLHPAMVYLNCQGYPHATRIDTVLDREAGNERVSEDGLGKRVMLPPVSEMAKVWEGHRYGGQALRPSFEFLAMAQKPYEGRPIENIVETGAGALNIYGSRVGKRTLTTHGPEKKEGHVSTALGGGWSGVADTTPRTGNWPPNVALVHSPGCCIDGSKQVSMEGSCIEVENWVCVADCPVRELKQDSPGTLDGFPQFGWNYEKEEEAEGIMRGRCFPKVSSEERDAGLDHLPATLHRRVNAGGIENDPKWAPNEVKCDHPTLKPLALNVWLAGILLPPEHYKPRRIVIPFCGAGSEMIGAMLAGWDEVVGIEMSERYAVFANARMDYWSRRGKL